MSLGQVPLNTQSADFPGRGANAWKSRGNGSEPSCSSAAPPLQLWTTPFSAFLQVQEVTPGLPGPAAQGCYSDISWNWARAGIILFPVGHDFLSNFHFLMYIPLGSEQLCLTQAGFAPLGRVLASCQLCVYGNGQSGSAVRWLPGQALAALPASPVEVGLRVQGPRLASWVILSLTPYLNL